MLQRTWWLLCGVPPGVLGAWALGASPPDRLELGGIAGGLLLWIAASRIAHFRDDDPARPAHLSVASSGGLAALPALAACVLGLGPGPPWLLLGVVALIGLLLLRAARLRAPSGGFPRQLVAAALALLGGSAAILLLSGLVAGLGAPPPPGDERRIDAIFDLDAGVATLPLPRCGARPAGMAVVSRSGARPRFGADADHVWFDAATDDGRRQIHRLERSSGRTTCWTCGEPGHNWRPAPGDSGIAVAFETDRHARWWDPTNTEIHLIRAAGAAPSHGSRRLTHAPGPDSHPLLGPGSQRLVWSRRQHGRHEVVSAAIRSAHGGMLLGGITALVSGGAGWTAPLAWSPDARSLVVVSGNPLRPGSATGIDLATGRRSHLGDDVAAGSAVAFNADGGWVAVAAARRRRVAGFLPASSGFALSAFAAPLERDRMLFRGSAVRLGEPWAVGAPLELDDHAAWGEPPGIALSPDGTTLVLGQRRDLDGRIEERMLEIALDCAPPRVGD